MMKGPLTPAGLGRPGENVAEAEELAERVRRWIGPERSRGGPDPVVDELTLALARLAAVKGGPVGRRRRWAMSITAPETILVDAFPNLRPVRLHTAAGPVGRGGTCFGPRAVAAHPHAAAPVLRGRDASPIARLGHDLGAGPARRSIGVGARALSAVGLALGDLLGQGRNVPLCRLRGGASRDRIRVHNPCVGYRPVAAAATARPARGARGVGGPPRGPPADHAARLARPEGPAASPLARGITAAKPFPFDASTTSPPGRSSGGARRCRRRAASTSAADPPSGTSSAAARPTP